MSVREFFDKSAAGYDAKYDESRSPFLTHFFRERLEAATRGVRIEGRVIWDIGAGTGQLYRHLCQLGRDFTYDAVDISAAMLMQSSVPAAHQHVGSFIDVAGEVADHSVDLFFMLGVTTYMTDAEVVETISTMEQKAASGATAIITITNRASLEHALQNAAGLVLSLPLVSKLSKSGTRVAGQSFQRNFMSLAHFSGLLPAGIKLASVTPLNQTYTPLNRIAFGPSRAIERLIRSATSESSAVRRCLSSDLLVRLQFGDVG